MIHTASFHWNETSLHLVEIYLTVLSMVIVRFPVSLLFVLLLLLIKMMICNSWSQLDNWLSDLFLQALQMP